jgi:hypothetical protein
MSAQDSPAMTDLIDVTRSGFDTLIKATTDIGADPSKKTKGGNLGGFTSAITSALGPMALLSSVMTGFLEPVEMITDPLTTIGEILGTGWYPILEPVSGFLYLVADGLSLMMSYLNQTPGLLYVLAGAFALLLIPFAPVIAGVLGVILVISLLATYWDVVVAGFWGVINFLGSVPSLIWNGLVTGFWAVINWFAALPQMILDAIVRGSAQFGSDVAAWWNDLWD